MLQAMYCSVPPLCRQVEKKIQAMTINTQKLPKNASFISISSIFLSRTRPKIQEPEVHGKTLYIQLGLWFTSAKGNERGRFQNAPNMMFYIEGLNYPTKIICGKTY